MNSKTIIRALVLRSMKTCTLTWWCVNHGDCKRPYYSSTTPNLLDHFVFQFIFCFIYKWVQCVWKHLNTLIIIFFILQFHHLIMCSTNQNNCTCFHSVQHLLSFQPKNNLQITGYCSKNVVVYYKNRWPRQLGHTSLSKCLAKL